MEFLSSQHAQHAGLVSALRALGLVARDMIPVLARAVYVKTLSGDATCALEDCVIEWSSNVGVLAHVGKSEATVSNCTLRHNFIASGVDDASTLSLCACWCPCAHVSSVGCSGAIASALQCAPSEP